MNKMHNILTFISSFVSGLRPRRLSGWLWPMGAAKLTITNPNNIRHKLCRNAFIVSLFFFRSKDNFSKELLPSQLQISLLYFSLKCSATLWVLFVIHGPFMNRAWRFPLWHCTDAIECVIQNSFMHNITQAGVPAYFLYTQRKRMLGFHVHTWAYVCQLIGLFKRKNVIMVNV